MSVWMRQDDCTAPHASCKVFDSAPDAGRFSTGRWERRERRKGIEIQSRRVCSQSRLRCLSPCRYMSGVHGNGSTGLCPSLAQIPGAGGKEMRSERRYRSDVWPSSARGGREGTCFGKPLPGQILLSSVLDGAGGQRVEDINVIASWTLSCSIVATVVFRICE